MGTAFLLASDKLYNAGNEFFLTEKILNPVKKKPSAGGYPQDMRAAIGPLEISCHAVSVYMI